MSRIQAVVDRLPRPVLSPRKALGDWSPVTCAFAGLCAAAMVAFAARAAEPPVPGVLIIHSNQRPTPANIIIEDTLRGVVPKGFKRPVEIYSEYLDNEWASVQKYGMAEAEFLRAKYGERNIRVIVADALPALQFAAQFRDREFPGVPVVHIAVARDRLEQIALPRDMIGNTENHDPTPTLLLALRLHPDSRRLVVIRGASDLDRRWDSRIRAAAARLDNGGVEIVYLSALPTAEVLQRIGALKRGDLVFTPGYFLDGAGEVTTPRESVERIAQASPVPVYGGFDTHVGTGIVGGYVTRFEDQAQAAGAIVVRLLAGASPMEIATSSAPRVLMVDWRQLRRWGIDESSLPTGNVVRFREPSVWVKYEWQITLIVVALVLQSLLIATLLIQRRRRRKAELVVLQQRLELAHALRLATVGEMTAAISHEVNQPLGAILSNADAAEMLLDSDPPSVDDLRRILADIRRDDLRASEVVRRMRGLLQKLEVQSETLDLNELVLDTTRLVGAEAARREIYIEVLSAPAPLLVRGDRVQLQQLLLNLIMNAMDAMAQTPAVFRKVTLHTSHKEGGKLEIAVSDAGHGIDARTIGHLFDSFFTTKPKGLGLGLSIARTIAETHGGSIRAENNPSVGATFRVTLVEALTASISPQRASGEASAAGAT